MISCAGRVYLWFSSSRNNVHWGSGRAGRRHTCVLPRRKRRVNEVNCEEVACVAERAALVPVVVACISNGIVADDRCHYDDGRIVAEKSISALNYGAAVKAFKSPHGDTYRRAGDTRRSFSRRMRNLYFNPVLSWFIDCSLFSQIAPKYPWRCILIRVTCTRKDERWRIHLFLHVS